MSERADGPRTQVVMIPRWLDNPYLALLTRELTARGFGVSWGERFDLRWLWAVRRRVDVIHFHWPEPCYVYGGRVRRAAGALSWITLGLFVVRLAAARLLRLQVIWTAHEVYPHDQKWRSVHRVAARVLASAAGRILVHDAATRESAMSEFGNLVERKIRIVPHGSYIGVYPPGRSRDVVRSELGIAPEAFVFLAFGSIRPYKSLDVLLDALANFAREDVVLLVVGEARDERTAEIVRAAARRDPRVKLLLGFVPDDGVRELFDASDVAVVARSDGGTSGALVLALSLGLPVIAARKPAYVDLLRGGAAGWLFNEGDAASLRACLAEASADREAARVRGAVALTVADEHGWQKVGEATASAIGALARRRARGASTARSSDLAVDG